MRLSDAAEDLLRHSLAPTPEQDWRLWPLALATAEWLRLAVAELVDAHLVEVREDGHARVTLTGRAWLVERGLELGEGAL